MGSIVMIPPLWRYFGVRPHDKRKIKVAAGFQALILVAVLAGALWSIIDYFDMTKSCQDDVKEF
eukprot:TRINITY_DN3642_c0_g1_i1.p2 TRINITY_DN3642_c0_g1~~TRINITY_DN3642_c0_g1_i1.p2  ORF type:complete len:73 (-),score=14.32 TRINITY_DN3642_c0_g1_i1:306-497(-)